jgi:hypothetical protein
MSQLTEPPDLELGPIAIWVLGRARDPERLNLVISVDTGTSSVRTEGDACGVSTSRYSSINLRSSIRP